MRPHGPGLLLHRQPHRLFGQIEVLVLEVKSPNGLVIPRPFLILLLGRRLFELLQCGGDLLSTLRCFREKKQGFEVRAVLSGYGYLGHAVKHDAQSKTDRTSRCHGDSFHGVWSKDSRGSQFSVPGDQGEPPKNTKVGGQPEESLAAVKQDAAC